MRSHRGHAGTTTDEDHFVISVLGEELTEESVEQSLIEVLGGRRDEFLRARWHEMFSEDTRQGTEHRIFVSLFKSGHSTVQSAADTQLPLQVGLMALSHYLAEISI